MTTPHETPKIEAAPFAAAPGGPYTRLTEAQQRTMQQAGAGAETAALDRRMTEGFNILHQAIAELREAFVASETRLRAEIAASEARLRAEIAASEVRLRAEMTELKEMIRALAESQQTIVTRVSRLEERTRTYARIGGAVIIAFVLLVLGALIQPAIQRAAAGLFGG